MLNGEFPIQNSELDWKSQLQIIILNRRRHQRFITRPQHSTHLDLLKVTIIIKGLGNLQSTITTYIYSYNDSNTVSNLPRQLLSILVRSGQVNLPRTHTPEIRIRQCRNAAPTLRCTKTRLDLANHSSQCQSEEQRLRFFYYLSVCSIVT